VKGVAVKSLAATSLEALPLILTLKEIAAVYRLSPSTIRRGLQNGTFRPRPWDHYPYRWTREDVAADLKRRREEHTRRAHGFAATRAKRAAKAPLTPRRSPRRAS
jgi:hypothetical protein